MSLIVDVKSIAGAEGDAVCHLLPVEIEHNAQAKVEQYFTTSIRNETEGKYFSFTFLLYLIKKKRNLRILI